MFDEATRFGSVEQRAPDFAQGFGGAFGIELVAVFHVNRSRLPSGRQADALGGLFAHEQVTANVNNWNVFARVVLMLSHKRPFVRMVFRHASLMFG
jgi:hypothetical protein